MSYRGYARLGLFLAAVLGCGGPALDLPQSSGTAIEVALDPPVDLSAAPLAFRARLRGAPVGAVWLFRGELSSYHDRALRQRELPQTLRERAVPLRYWREGGDTVLQPLVWLEPDEDYALAGEGQGALAHLHTSGAGRPRAARWFPRAVVPERAVVLCGADFPDQLPETVTLEPGARPLRITRGVFEVERADCLTLQLAQPTTERGLLPPSVAEVLLEPSELGGERAQTVATLACPEGEPVAGSCLQVLDDRVLVGAAGSAVLWLLRAPRATVLPLASFESGVLLDGLEPSSSFMLEGSVVLASGEAVPVARQLSTRPAQRHLVLNEVLANAAGAEPASEWIELLNDSGRAASLAGLWLEDGASSTPLPEVVLAPGELALLVGPGFRASALDVPVPAETRIIELRSLGARGLSNSGEPLLLVGREGVLSRFPALPAPHAGRSIARRSPSTPDDAPLGFGEHASPGASPGAPNTFD